MQPQNENQIASSSELASENNIVPQSTHLKLNKKNVIEFSLEDGNRYKAKILNRAGNSKGLYKNAYNIEYTSPEHLCGKKSYVDLDRVKDLSVSQADQALETTSSGNELPNTSGDTQVIYLTKDISFDHAKLAELQSWKQNEVYQEVPFSNQKYITVKWVCTMKETNEGFTPKARLVARGFEEDNQDEIVKESPTCSKDSLRIISARTAQKGWDLRSIDIKTAFLQEETLQGNDYIRYPKEAGCSKTTL